MTIENSIPRSYPTPVLVALLACSEGLLACSEGAGSRPSDTGGSITASTTGPDEASATSDATSSTNTTNTTTANTTDAMGDGDGDGDGGPRGTPTVEQLRVAFIGDQGLSSDATAVLELVISEGADFLLIAGDFDYTENPTAWDELNVAALGPDYPVFAVAGNHDEDPFYGPNGYQEKITDRLQPAIDDGAVCTGDMGLNSACSYMGLFMAFSGVDVYDSQYDSAMHLRDSLAANDAIWSVCAWHKNQNDMQAGSKGDEAGWAVYQACQQEGGIIITGHEHSYSRTLTLTDLGNETNGHGATGQPELMVVGEGSTFVSVVGTGGQALRDYEADAHADDTWWSTIYTTNYYVRDRQVVTDWDPVPGALFIDFYVDGDPYKASAYFKNINGAIIDEYDIVRDPVMTGDGDGDGDPTSGDGDGDPVDLTIVDFDDAYVDSESPSSNFGGASDLLIDHSPIYETFLRPNLAAIPANSTIATATLRVFSHDAGDDAELRVVSQAWSQDTVTYDSRPASGTALASFSTNTGWIEIDVTAAVQAWIDGAPNHGFHLRGDGSNGSDYYSTENGSNGPELLIWYAP